MEITEIDIYFFCNILEEELIYNFFLYLDILKTFNCKCQKKIAMPI